MAKSLRTIPYSITFENALKETRNTFSNWRLIPTTRPTIGVPGINTKFVTIPGRDDPYDLSTYLTGKIVKSAISGTFEFYFIHKNIDVELYSIMDDDIKEDAGGNTSPENFNLTPGGNFNITFSTPDESGYIINVNSKNTFISDGNWKKLRDDMLEFLHGQRLQMIFLEEPLYYYEGRFSFDGITPGEAFSTVKISYQVNANRKKVTTGTKK